MSDEERTMPQPEATFSELVRGIDVEEGKAPAINGGIGLLVVLACFGAGVLTILPDPTTRNPAPLIALVIVGSLLASGLTIVNPGDTKVVQFFGRYVGTIRRTGLVMTM
ncbi:MAG: SPFH domain-containing protein, partial [Propionibacteriaceae bacterium]|nr:SPFH domain-containing protein [Propionibacteriaceae bacterium]